MVMALPLLVPAVNAMLAPPLLAVATRLVGASGVAAGVTLGEADDAAVCHDASCAFAVNV